MRSQCSQSIVQLSSAISYELMFVLGIYINKGSLKVLKSKEGCILMVKNNGFSKAILQQIIRLRSFTVIFSISK